jgi:hypothetical protein
MCLAKDALGLPLKVEVGLLPAAVLSAAPTANVDHTGRRMSLAEDACGLALKVEVGLLTAAGLSASPAHNVDHTGRRMWLAEEALGRPLEVECGLLTAAVNLAQVCQPGRAGAEASDSAKRATAFGPGADAVIGV